MELLVVISIITIFAGVIGYGFLRGSGSATVGLQASQSIVVGLLTQARSQAVLTGKDAALLVCSDTGDANRFMRFAVVALKTASGRWEPIDAGYYLPPGCYIVPRAALGADVSEGGSWAGLTSTALSLSTIATAAETKEDTEWLRVEFKAQGTTANSGRIVIALARTDLTLASPHLIYTQPDAVRAVALTSYGLVRSLNSRSDFDP